jgi:hypothetical protein
MEEKISRLFGYQLSYEQRVRSYTFLEDFISHEVSDWSIPPDTTSLIIKFFEVLKGLNNNELSFLLCHSGYIPEFYSHDSSEETLYSKLVEALVCEWSIRIGFKESTLQTQKSSKEDITIKTDNSTIVCDSKSFRLGRSQGSPNVKDTIKKDDYRKWLENYHEDHRIGGMITFPSLHNWQKGSDVFSYCSDKNNPILFLFYEHLSFTLLFGISHKNYLDVISQYDKVFPNTVRKSSEYFQSLITNLFRDKTKDFIEFNNLINEVIIESVQVTIKRISERLDIIKSSVTEEVNSIPEDEIRPFLIESRYHNSSYQLQKNLINIRKFRPH